MQTARRSTGGKAQVARPGRSPPRVRKPPFLAPVPTAVAAVATARPIYLTQAPQPKADLFDHLQTIACVAFLSIVIIALVGPSALVEASYLITGQAPSPPTFVPFQQRGLLSWLWLFVKSSNEW